MLNDTIFSLPFMQRAFLAALAIGLAAPAHRHLPGAARGWR